MSAAPSVTQCASLSAETAGQNCNGTFPKKNHAGLCACCTLLQSAPAEKVAEMMVRSPAHVVYFSSPAHKAQNYPQCVDCGTKYRFMKAQPDGRYICGPCTILADIPHQSPALTQQQADRTARMDRLTLQRLQNRGGTASTTTNAPQASTPKRPFINVDIFIGGRSGKAKNQSVIGNMGYQFDSDDSMEGALQFIHSVFLRGDLMVPVYRDSNRVLPPGRCSCLGG